MPGASSAYSRSPLTRRRFAVLGDDYSATMPPVPFGRGGLLFTRNRARRMPAFLSADGQDFQLQPALYANRIAQLKAVNNAATQQLDGLAVTNVAAPTAVAVASTNSYAAMVRHRYTTTATAATGAGVRSASAQWFLSQTPNMGGFFFVCRFGLNTVATSTRGFVGMSSTTAALAPATNPSALLNQIGFGWDTTDTALQFMSNDGTGTSTKVNLGASFPVTTSAATYFYEVQLFAPSGAGSLVNWSAIRLNDGAVSSGATIADLPAIGTLLAAHVHYSNGTNAVAESIDLQSLYIESDN